MLHICMGISPVETRRGMTTSSAAQYIPPVSRVEILVGRRMERWLAAPPRFTPMVNCQIHGPGRVSGSVLTKAREKVDTGQVEATDNESARSHEDYIAKEMEDVYGREPLGGSGPAFKGGFVRVKATETRLSHISKRGKTLTGAHTRTWQSHLHTASVPSLKALITHKPLRPVSRTVIRMPISEAAEYSEYSVLEPVSGPATSVLATVSLLLLAKPSGSSTPRNAGLKYSPRLMAQRA
ncbi:hypothetical protein CSOJ01_15417 [Colletotrichum sojae]|uniref:Uncharacterized protein n=1 Tax=Colletotrichum sojae TaxID=2175907 RepID=A0A8H6MI55_9PEZI|nr:hypothetical protein CSOJ01_15417 [Colletotrichum sojae]